MIPDTVPPPEIVIPPPGYARVTRAKNRTVEGDLVYRDGEWHRISPGFTVGICLPIARPIPAR